MKNRNLVKVGLSALLATSLFLVSCDKTKTCIQGQGAITTKTLSVSSFSGIDLAGAANVVIKQGENQEVTATGQLNIIDAIKTKVSNNIWDIDFIDGCYENYELTIYITMPDLKDIRLSGTGNITVEDFTNQGNLAIDVEGAGNITLNAFDNSENLTVNISGSGHIEGKSDFQDLKKITLNISGAGEFNGFPIQTNECKSTISGTGNCNVYVRDLLDVNISGAGNVYYKGNPEITSKITGSGTVIDAN